MHPGLAKGSYGPLSCDISNPRVMEAIFIDPPTCMCRLCPEGYTSDGGNPAQAACFLPAGPVQAFSIMYGLEEEAPAGGGRRLANAPLDVQDAATALANIWAGVLSHVPESLLGALEPIADFTLDGPVKEVDSLSFDVQEPYLFSARYIFHASEASRDAVVEAINSVAQDPDFKCADWVAHTGVDMCALVRDALPPGYRLVDPWAEPLPAASGGSGRRLMQSSSTAAHRVLFLPLAISGIFGFITKGLACLGKGVDQYKGKGFWKMPYEGRAMFFDSAVQGLSAIFSIWSLAQGKEDKITPYLQQIDKVRRWGVRRGRGGEGQDGV